MRPLIILVTLASIFSALFYHVFQSSNSSTSQEVTSIIASPAEKSSTLPSRNIRASSSSFIIPPNKIPLKDQLQILESQFVKPETVAKYQKLANYLRKISESNKDNHHSSSIRS